jgi:phosphatidylglycerol lysyltransferase
MSDQSTGPAGAPAPSCREAAWRRWLRHLPPLVGVVLLLVAVYVVQKEFRHLKLEDIEAALRRIPRDWLGLGFAIAVCAYLVLTLYDLLGSIYAQHLLPYRRIAFASFCAYALSHNLGFSALSGAAVRFRLYAGWGLAPLQIGKLVAFCSLTFGFGGLVIGGAALLLEPRALPFIGAALPLWLLHLLGLALWGAVATYLVVAAHGRDICVFGHVLRLPGLRMAVLQVMLATTDVCVTSSIFYALLPHGHGLTFFRFLAIYVMSYSAGVAASLPGGIGVFDTVMLLGLSAYMPAARVVGGLLIFRLYYYIIPLFLAGSLFAGHELLLRGRVLLRGAAAGRPAVRRNEPDFAIAAATGVVALCGMMLLAIGIIAPDPDVSWIDPGYADSLATAGHFIPSLIGAALMVFAIGLSQRVTLAWGGTLVLLILGAAMTAAQGRLWWIPGILLLAALMLAPYRGSFHRHARLLSGRMQSANAIPLFALIGCLLALAVFERHVRFVSYNSWWKIVVSPVVPNSVRLAVGLSVLVGLIAIWRLLLPGRAVAAAWTLEARLRYAALGASPPSRADGIIWGEAGRAALPFRRIGRVLLGLGDPAGPVADRASAVWRLRDLAQKEGRDPAVYRVGTELLEVYGALGLAALPLGPDGLPLPEQTEDAVAASAYLMCLAERDLAVLLPVLPDLAGPPRLRRAA